MQTDDGSSTFLRVEGVHRTYRLGETEVRALRGVSVALRRGEFTAVVGASGSGKSTLLNVIGCIDDPDQGRVLIDGQEAGTLSDDQKSALRNEKIGFIFQSFNLIPVLDVYENVELPLLVNPTLSSSKRRERVLAALLDVGLLDRIRHKPDKLSGGQRQRVAIARALVGQPRLVLADEPTANLDSETARKIVDLMLSLNEKRGVTFLFSTHDEKLISRVGRVLHIEDGVLTS